MLLNWVGTVASQREGPGLNWQLIVLSVCCLHIASSLHYPTPTINHAGFDKPYKDLFSLFWSNNGSLVLVSLIIRAHQQGLTCTPQEMLM